jgi:hypothetical protein
MDLEKLIQQILDELESGSVPRELWPVALAALVEARFVSLPR